MLGLSARPIVVRPRQAALDSPAAVAFAPFEIVLAFSVAPLGVALVPFAAVQLAPAAEHAVEYVVVQIPGYH